MYMATQKEEAAWREALNRDAVIGGNLAVDARLVIPKHRICRVEVPASLACHWTVTLGAPPRSIIAAGIPGQSLEPHFRLFADIDWGVGGAAYSVHVDWRQGAQFSLFGNYFEVAVVNPIASPGPGAARYSIHASLSPGAVGNSEAIRTVFLGAVAGGASANGSIPAFATRVGHFFLSPGGNLDRRSFQFMAETGVLAQQLVYNTTASRNFPQYSEWSRFPSSASQFVYRNHSINAHTEVEVPFLLAL